jgi:hypothetical protein
VLPGSLEVRFGEATVYGCGRLVYVKPNIAMIQDSKCISALGSTTWGASGRGNDDAMRGQRNGKERPWAFHLDVIAPSARELV